MKLETAIKYCHEIHRRLMEVNGVIPTPTAQHPAVKIKKIWVFGSTVKGSTYPNDLDLLIKSEPIGEKRSWEEVGFNNAYYRAHGLRVTKCSRTEAVKWLSKGMKKVSRHDTSWDGVKPDLKVELYPRFKVKFPQLKEA